MLEARGREIDDSSVEGIEQELCGAAREGDAENVSAYLQSGADANAKDDNESLLHCATDAGVVRLLLRHGADSNTTDGDMTALQKAVEHENVELVRAFVEMGVDLDVRSKGGLAALHLALDLCEPKIETITRILVEGGADVNVTMPQSCLTPLDILTDEGHENLARLLVDHGATASD